MKTKIKAELQYTENLDLFEMHEHNRPLHDNPDLMRSMRRYGFMPSSPLQVQRATGGKFKVIRGHHRLNCAKQLGIGAYFIIDETQCDIFDLEGGCGQNWTAGDFAVARARAGDKDCAAMLEFKEKHGLTLGAASSLVGGESAGSTNKIRLIKTGSFKVGDMKHANDVVAITDLCGKSGVRFAKSSAFVAAVSMVLRVPKFDQTWFAHQIEQSPHILHKRGRVDEYLDEIEELYNHGARESKRLAVAFLAGKVARKRQMEFGDKRSEGKK